MIGKYLFGLAMAVATVFVAGPADAQVRYQGDFIARGNQPITFDFTLPTFITTRVTFTPAQTNCTAPGTGCNTVDFTPNSSNPFAPGRDDRLGIDYANQGSDAYFTTGAFDTFGSYSSQLRDTLVGTLTVSDASVAATPEPAAWALLIGGFGAAGGMLRRRRRVAVRAVA